MQSNYLKFAEFPLERAKVGWVFIRHLLPPFNKIRGTALENNMFSLLCLTDLILTAFVVSVLYLKSVLDNYHSAHGKCLTGEKMCGVFVVSF